MGQYNENRGFNQNRNNNYNENVKPAQQVEETPCACEEKKNLLDRTKELGSKGVDLVKKHPVETVVIAAGTAIVGGYVKKGRKLQKEGKSFWHIPLAEEITSAWARTKSLFGRKEETTEAPAEEAPKE